MSQTTVSTESEPEPGAEPIAESGGSRTPHAGDGRRLRIRTLRNPWVSVPLVLLLAAGVWFVVANRGGSSSSAATTTTQLAAVTKGPIGNTVSAEGTIAALQTANLTFPASGTVSSVAVKAGDTVTAGQVLATLDSSQLASSLSSAQANLA
jgi:multidrug efflux pump subunit AcrA (membrane-fusion protein)